MVDVRAMAMLALMCAPAQGMEIERIEAKFVAPQYRCELEAVIAAPADRVAAVLRAYHRYPQLDARILSARVIERDAPDAVTLETELRACFGPICRTVRRVEAVQEAPLTLSASADPARSEVRFNETQTTLEVLDDGRTRVRYSTSVEPGFWIPAFIGRPWAVSTLRDATLALFENVERAAQSADATKFETSTAHD